MSEWFPSLQFHAHLPFSKPEYSLCERIKFWIFAFTNFDNPSSTEAIQEETGKTHAALKAICLMCQQPEEDS